MGVEVRRVVGCTVIDQKTSYGNSKECKMIMEMIRVRLYPIWQCAWHRYPVTDLQHPHCPSDWFIYLSDELFVEQLSTEQSSHCHKSNIANAWNLNVNHPAYQPTYETLPEWSREVEDIIVGCIKKSMCFIRSRDCLLVHIFPICFCCVVLYILPLTMYVNILKVVRRWWYFVQGSGRWVRQSKGDGIIFMWWR